MTPDFKLALNNYSVLFYANPSDDCFPLLLELAESYEQLFVDYLISDLWRRQAPREIIEVIQKIKEHLEESTLINIDVTKSSIAKRSDKIAAFKTATIKKIGDLYNRPAIGQAKMLVIYSGSGSTFKLVDLLLYFRQSLSKFYEQGLITSGYPKDWEIDKEVEQLYVQSRLMGSARTLTRPPSPPPICRSFTDELIFFDDHFA